MTQFTIMPDKTIRDPSGKRFIVKGVTMFDYLFVSFEPERSNWLYREVRASSDKREASGVSEPTYYAKVSYDLGQIEAAQACGAQFLVSGFYEVAPL